MSTPKTLFQMAGAEPQPSPLSQSTLVIIDAQNEYTTGDLKLPGVRARIRQIADLLARARAAGRPVVHVRHVGRPGGLFDPGEKRSAIVAKLKPKKGEAVVEKMLPNAFANTDLAARLAELGPRNLIVTGFMTHMCVSATVRSALDHGLNSTVVADACGTRALPDPTTGRNIAANTVHRAALAGLADRFATIAKDADAIPD